MRTHTGHTYILYGFFAADEHIEPAGRLSQIALYSTILNNNILLKTGPT